MLHWITCLFGLSRRYLPSSHHEDISGSFEPTLDDLRAEAIDFERQVKAHIGRESGKMPTGPLGQLIRDMLPKYPKYPQIPGFWDGFVVEAAALKELRNNIAHSDVQGLPPLPEIYGRFKKANDVLRPFTVCSVPRDRFTQFFWVKSLLHFKIDEQVFRLSERDIENLLVELHPSSRGKVRFKAGKQIHSAMLDIKNESRTYFVEDCAPFNLDDQEAMALDDLLISYLGPVRY
ncbi:hypothetical protein [Pseudomonas citrulli]|uniref:Swt1-like HEPN domain-containing protein n=3 Tax=Pseudomonas TaxID=286 RepID=A0A0G3GNE9_9PSED|nr:hypothetical protein [Pseudomonas sp. K18]AKK01093.1 hypothetical protein VM99_24640 [Pseudomonas chlororaphis]MDO7896344.1 hypothetical protein [Pseudomonas sp. K18]